MVLWVSVVLLYSTFMYVTEDVDERLYLCCGEEGCMKESQGEYPLTWYTTFLNAAHPMSLPDTVRTPRCPWGGSWVTRISTGFLPRSVSFDVVVGIKRQGSFGRNIGGPLKGPPKIRIPSISALLSFRNTHPAYLSINSMKIKMNRREYFYLIGKSFNCLCIGCGCIRVARCKGCKGEIMVSCGYHFMWMRQALHPRKEGVVSFIAVIVVRIDEVPSVNKDVAHWYYMFTMMPMCIRHAYNANYTFFLLWYFKNI